MKKIACVLFFFSSLIVSAQPVDSLRPIIDTGLAKMQQYALHRNEINWPEFKKKVYAQTKGISTLDSLLNQFPLFFQWLNDFHGAVATPTEWIKWRGGRPRREINAMLDSALEKGPRLKVDRWGHIGYFRVPSVPAVSLKDMSAWTQRLVDSLCKVNPATAKGWIIDLRLNTGGNVWPMLATLGSLIGEGTIGGLKYIDGKADDVIFIKDGKPFGNNQFYSIPNQTCTLPSAEVPVAVLTGPMTGSSGEALLLAFVGRPNTIIIGEPTSGYVTSNNNFNLHPKATLFLATAYMQDRTGKYYINSIQPDILIKDGDDFYNLSKDQKVKKAIEWLHTKMKK